MNDSTERPGEALLRCTGCGDEFGNVRLVWLDDYGNAICQDCGVYEEVTHVGYVQNWRSEPVGGELTRQSIEERIEVPSL